MCFSATASYTASAALLITGLISLYKTKPRMRMIAAIPLLFSIQQLSEGITWQALSRGTSAQLSTYVFLFFVFIIWPLWVPLATRSIAHTAQERSLLNIPIVAGSYVAAFALLYASSIRPIAAITCTSIRYIEDLPIHLWGLGSIAYLIATITPFFIIRQRYFWLMGSALAISYVVTFILYHQTLISVWCFFTAILSILTLLIIW